MPLPNSPSSGLAGRKVVASGHSGPAGRLAQEWSHGVANGRLRATGEGGQATRAMATCTPQPPSPYRQSSPNRSATVSRRLLQTRRHLLHCWTRPLPHPPCLSPRVRHCTSRGYSSTAMSLACTAAPLLTSPTHRQLVPVSMAMGWGRLTIRRQPPQHCQLCPGRGRAACRWGGRRCPAASSRGCWESILVPTNSLVCH